MTMKTSTKYLLLPAFLLSAASVSAQDSYDAQTFSNKDLNGTARYVAMGGALGALGGDISTMSSNPAGTAIYRSSDAAITVSELFTGKGAMEHDGYRMSLDQGGALIAFDMDNPSGKGLQFINFGINYQKKRNFLSNLRTNVQGLDNTFSQTFQIADLCADAWVNDYYGSLANMSAGVIKSPNRREGLLYEKYYDKNMQYLGDDLFTKEVVDDNGNKVANPDYLLPANEDKVTHIEYSGVGAKSAVYERATYGANVQADVNLSFNVSDQFFFGFSMGVYDLDYSRESFYQEQGVDGITYDFTNWYKTTGDGFDVKLGVIIRPIEDSPFRIGLMAHTPTWYRLRDANGSTLYMDNEFLASTNNGDYEYRFRTPWTLGVSLGHTIGNYFAIGAEYEFQDLSTAHYSEYGFNGEDYMYFRNVNKITEQTLKAQHTLKIGLEWKPIEEFAFRLGYNYISSPFKNNAYRTIGYDGTYTETDYTNWGDTHRFTFGVGYRFKGGYFDIAYQYQGQKGDFYAFDEVDLKATKIDNNRHQVMGTLGFRF